MTKLRISFIYLTTFTVIHFTAYSSGPSQSELTPKTHAHKFIDADGNPTPAFTTLLGKLNVKHQGTLPSINEVLQKKETGWLRPAGVEREECDEVFPQMRQELMPIYRQLGVIDEVAPTQKEYDYAVVFSNMVRPVRQRLNYTHTVSEQGITFKEIHLLGGRELPLKPKFESEQVLLDQNNPDLPFRNDWKFDGKLPKDETEKMDFLYNQGRFTAQFRAIPKNTLDVTVEDAQNSGHEVHYQKKADGSITRVNTGTQVLAWLNKYGLKGGKALWISNQPYVDYQGVVVESYAPSSFHVETVGPQADLDKPNLNLDILDTSVRLVYQEKARREKVSQEKK